MKRIPPSKQIVRDLITSLEIDDHLSDPDATAVRVGEMYAEVFSGVKVDPSNLFAHLIPLTDETGDAHQIVILSAIPFFSMCEHHFLPFYGYVDICFVPDKYIIGIGRLTQLVQIISRRPQLQEKMIAQLAEIINKNLSPLGLGIHIIAKHLCEAMRGVREDHQIFTTVKYHGVLNTEQSYRDSFTATLTTRI
jgi:GTP cyclohydrolase I